MEMTIKEAVLAYMTVLNVPQIQHKLSREEITIGTQNIAGCLFAIEDRLYEQGDTSSLSLVNIIQERERINGRIYDVNDSKLIESTRNCAEKLFDYYVKKCR
jgi:hypothetical protein